MGRDKAVMDVPQFGPIFGYSAGEFDHIAASSLHSLCKGAVWSLLTKQHSHVVVRAIQVEYRVCVWLASC